MPTRRTPPRPKPPAAKKRAAKTSPAAAEPIGILAVLPRLPDPHALYRTVAALSVLDAIAGAKVRSFQLWREPDHAHFRYAHGNGDTLDAFFSAEDHLIRGFDHESPASPYELGDLLPGIYQGMPDIGPLPTWTFAQRGEPTCEDAAGGDGAVATFAAWFHKGRWRAGKPKFPPFGPLDSDGAEYLLGCLTPTVRFCEERGWPRARVDKVMAHAPLSDADILALSPAADLARVRAEMTAVGYGGPLPFR